ncbi:MAG: YheU family protein [Methylococcaceae bacterium]|nr:YheU family protein [Methylococcaceae bacterium]
MTPIIIPHHSLEPETLRAMLEEFVTRDGTDYGAQEISLNARVDQVLRQVRTGKAVIVYDSEGETFSILPKEQVHGV